MRKNDIGFGFELVKMSQFRRVNKCTVNCVHISHWTEKLLEIPNIDSSETDLCICLQ